MKLAPFTDQTNLTPILDQIPQATASPKMEPAAIRPPVLARGRGPAEGSSRASGAAI